jgi:hypothetical protein
MAPRKRPFCGPAADVARDRGYFRPQSTSLRPAVFAILIDIFGTSEDLSWHADRCSRARTTAVFRHPGRPRRLARQYTFTRSDQDLVAARRGTANQLGFAVQLALLRHPGMGWRTWSRSASLSSAGVIAALQTAKIILPARRRSSSPPPFDREHPWTCMAYLGGVSFGRSKIRSRRSTLPGATGSQDGCVR